MGIVYKARQISLNRIVALKMLPAIQPISTEELVRFRTEAEALAKLRHPNIVTIFEIAESEGRPYFTMEYIAGPSLADVLRGRPQDVAASARLLEITARAVHAVHECGFIHRDLKPANVLLHPKSEIRNPKPEKAPIDARSDVGFRISDFEPKITDFGIAKDQDDQRKLTKTGAVMGTPSYMAPEQARGEAAIGPATDICSLGAILYEMLTGRPPFDAGDPASTLAQLQTDEPLSPLSLRPNLPRDVVTICLKCLEKLPRKRYQTALELAEDLQRFQAGRPIQARPVRFFERAYRWCRRRPLVAGLLALSTLLALTCIATVISYEIRLNEALKMQIAEEDKEILVQKQHIVQLHVQIGISAIEEGDTFAAVFHFTQALSLDEGSERESRHRMRIGNALRRCPRPTAVMTLEREVLCAHHNRVVTMSANNSIEVREIPGDRLIVSGLTQTEMPSAGTLSPDGRSLGVLSENGTATIWDLSGRQPHHLASADRSERASRLLYHPNCRVLLVQRTNGTLEEWDLNTWTKLPWESLTEGAIFSTFSDDGGRLLTCAPDHGQVWDMGTGKPTGPALQFGHRVHAAGFAPDGRKVAVVGPDNDLSIWDVPAGRRVGKSVKLPDAVTRIALSPDGDRVATLGKDQILRLWQVPLGALVSQTPILDGANTRLGFSLDGHYLLTMGEIGGARVFDAVTGLPVTPPLRLGGRLASAEFRADGREVETVSKNGIVCVWELPHGPQLRRGAADTIVSGPGKSPTSRSIRLSSGMTVRTEGMPDGPLIPPPRGANTVEKAIVSPDGNRIAHCEDATTVLVWDITKSETRPPSLHHRSPVRYAAFNSDGRLILTACADRTVRLWDADTGELLSPPMWHPLDIKRVVFDAAGEHAQVVEDDGTVCLWELKEDNRSLPVLQALSQVIAGEQVYASQGGRQQDFKALRENWEKFTLAK
jgi:WD40 repeat protein